MSIPNHDEKNHLAMMQGHLVSQVKRLTGLTDTRGLILDEATSSVDTRTERLIQAALEKLLQGRTSFVSAHRLRTIRNADQVLVIENGVIVERGTHASLLALKGVYYGLYMRQFRQEDNGAANAAPAAALKPGLAPGR